MRRQLRFVLPAVSALLAIVLVLVLALALGGSKHGTPKPTTEAAKTEAGAFDGAALPSGVKAPDFALTAQDGREVSLSSYGGRVVALVFLPTSALASGASPRCRACLLVAQQVRGALDELGARPAVKVIFVSGALRAPEGHTAGTRARVRHLLAETSLTGRVDYLTGDAAEMGRVWRAYRIPLPASINTKAEAATTVLLIDKRGFERVAFGIEQITPEGLSHDIGLLEGA